MRFRNVPLALAGCALVATGAPPAHALNAAAPLTNKVVVTPGLAKQLAGDLTKTSVAAVHFRAGTAEQRAKVLDQAGLATVVNFAEIDTTFVEGPLSAIGSLQASPLVDHLQDDGKIDYFDDTAAWATRSRVLQNSVGGGPYTDGNGAILDGRGIGIAVIDSGADAGHPDLINRVATNTRFACAIIVESTTPQHGCYPPQGNLLLPPGTNNDLLSGHGTFVAGMAAGDGTASGGLHTGTAPAAKLHIFGMGAGDRILWVTSAWAKLYSSFSTYSPTIKVINNSYGDSGGDYDPLDPITMFANKVVNEKDAVVVFSAGNDGGDGSGTGNTSSYCRNPTPGVICAANYDELNTGTRNGALDVSSSRGIAADASQTSWPDLAAPGAFVTSTCSRTSGVLCDAPGLITPTLDYEIYYGNGSGTSFSAPMIAGGVALLRQANPALTAAAVEDILKDTAHKFPGPYVTDVLDGTRTTSFDKGAGLMDLVAAASDSRVAATAGGSSAVPVTLASGDGGDALFGANDIVSATATPGATGVTYTITVADATDRSPAALPTLRVTQLINGVSYLSDVSMATATTVTLGAGNGAPTSASISGNTVTMFVPYTKFANPAVGDVAHNVFVSSFLGVIMDSAPGPQSGLPTDVLLAPRRTQYTVR